LHRAGPRKVVTVNYTLHCAEVVRWSELYIGKKFHAVMCDPPYGLGFMDKDWDEAVHSKEWGEALIPILYPGALVFMFGGTRTWHKLATGMEAAGFEILDTLMWIHGSGFPKAQSIDKQLDDESGADRTPIMETKRDLFGEFEQEKKRTDGAGNTGDETVPFAPPSSKNYSVTEPSEAAAPWAGHKTPALKPAWEPIIMFRAPREGYSYGQLAEKFGSGCLNTDGARIETREAGSGSEMIGAIQADRDEVEGIEESKEFCKIAQAQLDYWAKLAVQINMFE